MELARPMLRDFVLLEAAWERAPAGELLARVASPWVVVRQGAGVTRAYHVFPREPALRLLTTSACADIGAALALATHPPARTVDLDAPVPRGPKAPMVVLDAHGVVGILTTGGNTRGGLGGAGRSAARGPDSGPSAEPVVRHLEASLPPSVALGRELSLLVSLNAKASSGAPGMPVALPVGTSVVVVVQTTGGLELDGPDQQTLEITEPQSELPVRFALRAARPGPAAVRVHAFHGSAPLGSLRLATSVVEPGQEATGARVTERAPVRLVQHTAPDLSLYVFADHDRELRYHLASADGRFTMKRFGPVPFRISPEEHFRAFFQGIEGLPVDTAQDREIACRQIAAKGADLFDRLFPDDLKVLLWELQDQISTVQVLSEDPWIPWELCKPTGKVKGYVQEGPFFAERFCITRWRTGTPARPRLTLEKLALVVPDDSGLPSAQKEKDFILSLKRAGREVTEIKPTYLGVTDAMATGRFDAWHFAGHASASPGNNADQAFIELRDLKKLTPEHLSGRVANVLVPQPFVFLNACQSGRAGLSLTGLGGWADRFLGRDQEGAAAFVGTYWQVFDDAALQFSRKLYELLLAGQPMGVAVRDARAAIRSMDELSWLAYTAYADPFARVG